MDHHDLIPTTPLGWLFCFFVIWAIAFSWLAAKGVADWVCGDWVRSTEKMAEAYSELAKHYERKE